MANPRMVPVGKLGMLGACAVLLISPRPVAAQCGMMGGGGHDHGSSQEQASQEKASPEEQIWQDIDRLLSDEQGRVLLADALLADNDFMRDFIVRLIAIPEWDALVTRMQAEASFDGDAAAPVRNVRRTASYTCPMHPDVTTAAPGACPKCGMRLERATTAGRE